MKRRLLFTFVFALAAILILLSARPNVFEAHAAPEEKLRSTPMSALLQGQERAASKNEVTAATTVRAVDVEGLKKLLQREAGSNNQARPLLINFWATWCDPCRAEFPDLVRIDEDYRNRGLDFITVSLDDPSEINTLVPQFLQRMRARMPAYLLNTPEPDVAIAVVDPTWSGGLPATFLFDASGQIAFKHTGQIKPKELRAAIDKLIRGQGTGVGER